MSRIGPLLSPLLVGRDDLLHLADRRIAEAATGRGQLVLLAGEPGVGKTRLLAAITRKAMALRFRHVRADLSPQDCHVPLASVLDLGRSMRDEGSFGTVGVELLAMRVGHEGDVLGARRLLVRDIAERIASACDTPTLLAFEDLQWTDEMSLEVIGEVARLTRDRPVLMVGVYRSGELPAGSIHREWRARLLSQRLAEEARLAPLTYDETALVTTLIMATGLPAPREVVDAVYRRTDGIPLHIEELLGAIGEDGWQDGAAIREAEVPETIEDATLARFARLSDDTRTVARAGAVIGRCFVPQVLAGVLDRPVNDLDDALQELVDNGFLFTFGWVDQGYYDFRHQLLRDALYGNIPAADLRQMHARAAEFGVSLEGQSEIHASAHYERAGLRRQAYRAALAGAVAASSLSSRRESFELYSRALDNVPDDLEPGELSSLYEGYLAAASSVDRVDAGLAAAPILRTLEVAAGHAIGAADALVWEASFLGKAIAPLAERNALLDKAIEELRVTEPSADRDETLAQALQLRGTNDIVAGRYTDARARLAESHAVLEAHPGSDLNIDAEFYTCYTDALERRAEDAIPRMLDLARAARDAKFESSGVTAYRNVSLLASRLMDYRTAAIAIGEGMRYADEIEQSYCRRLMAWNDALLAWAAGRWNDAVQAAELELVERGSERGTVGCRDVIGFVALGRGSVERARALLDESLELGRKSGEAGLQLPALWGLAEAALVAGEPAVAAARCEDALRTAVDGTERALMIPFVVTGVRAYQATRQPEEAERWVARVRDWLDGWTGPAEVAFHHAEGLVRLAAGASVLARGELEVAAAGWDSLTRTWESAWARLDLAAALVRAGRHADAAPVIAAAREIADRLDSAPLRARADALGQVVRSRGAMDEPWRPLTVREFEVARLVARGMTNAEIAEELVLSPKTVSAHLEHILGKLGAMRRAEVAAWVSTIRTPVTAGDRG